ncbi:MAG: lytic transglycosylase domain-containing protein [bacterium]|nr:lytic transglycosylase domain-containing protein [bacterium]
MIEGVERVLYRIEEIKKRFGDYFPYINTEHKTQKKEFKDVLEEVENTQHSTSNTQYPKPSIQDQEGVDALIDKYSEKYGVDRALINAVIKVESNFNPRAISPKGACGLMQLMPKTAKLLGVDDPFSPAQNIEGGVRYLRSLLDEFGGDISLALAAYNAGPTLVKRLGRIPKIFETENYVQRVMRYYKSQASRG